MSRTGPRYQPPGKPDPPAASPDDADPLVRDWCAGPEAGFGTLAVATWHPFARLVDRELVTGHLRLAAPPETTRFVLFVMADGAYTSHRLETKGDLRQALGQYGLGLPLNGSAKNGDDSKPAADGLYGGDPGPEEADL